MKIAINLLFLRPGKVGGSEVFTRNLISNLIELDDKNDYLLLVPKNTKNTFSFKGKSVDYLELNIDNSGIVKRVLFEQLIIPSKIKREKIDLVINPGNTGILFSSCKQIIVIHDLIFFVYPEYFSFFKRNYLRFLVKLSARKADNIATISQNTKEDIVKFLGVDSDKISVIYGGVDFNLFSEVDKSEAQDVVFKEYGIDNYLYSPSSIYPHKNNEVLIKSFAKLKKEGKIDQKLVITGVDPHNKKGDLEVMISDLGMRDEISYLGRVPFKHIPLLYKGAKAVVYLSKYEGFGLPVIEAMSAGVPVLASNRSSLPEVVGEGGVLVDPDNIDEITDGLHRLLTEEGLKEKCIEKGVMQAKRFSWKKTAGRMIDIYNRL